MTRCSICALPSEKLAAVDEALRDGVSLAAIAERTGTSKSSLHRHRHHLAPAAGSDPPRTTAIVAKNEQRRPQTASGRTAAVRPARVQPTLPVADRETAMAEALARAELLFNEALDGLEAAKATITLTKPDGGTLELPGDLRARAAFIRVGESVADQLARLRGLFEPSQSLEGAHITQVILLPKIAGLEKASSEPVTVDSLPDRSRTSDSIERGPVVDGSVEPPTGN